MRKEAAALFLPVLLVALCNELAWPCSWAAAVSCDRMGYFLLALARRKKLGLLGRHVVLCKWCWCRAGPGPSTSWWAGLSK